MCPIEYALGRACHPTSCESHVFISVKRRFEIGGLFEQRSRGTFYCGVAV